MNNKTTVAKRLSWIFLAAVHAGSGVATAQNTEPSSSGDRKGNGACQEDIERLCSDASDRRARKQCMRERKGEMSQECQRASESRRGRRNGGGRGNNSDM
jgi:hypothetical protein